MSKSIDKHTTHYACQEQLDKYGGKTKGCCCTGHDCKPVKSIDKQWKKTINELIEICCKSYQAGGIAGDKDGNRVPFAPREWLIEEVETLLKAEREKAVEEERERSKRILDGYINAWSGKNAVSIYPESILRSIKKELTAR